MTFPSGEIFGSSTSLNPAQSCGFRIRPASAANETLAAKTTTPASAKNQLRRITKGSAPAPPKRISAMGAAAADGAFAAFIGLRLEECGVEIRKSLQFQSRNF